MKYIKLLELSSDLLKRTYVEKEKQLDNLRKKYKLSDIKSDFPRNIISHLCNMFFSYTIKGVTNINEFEAKKYTIDNYSDKISDSDIKIISKSTSGFYSTMADPPDELKRKKDRHNCLKLSLYDLYIEIYIKKYSDDYFIVYFYQSSLYKKKYFLCDQIISVSKLLKKLQQIVIPDEIIYKRFNNIATNKQESDIVKDELIKELKNKYYIGTYDETKEEQLYNIIDQDFKLSSSDLFTKDELNKLMFLDLKSHPHSKGKPYGTRYNILYNKYLIDFYFSLYKIEDYYVCFLRILDINLEFIYKFDTLDDYIKFVKYYIKNKK